MHYALDHLEEYNTMGNILEGLSRGFIRGFIRDI